MNIIDGTVHVSVAETWLEDAGGMRWPARCASCVHAARLVLFVATNLLCACGFAQHVTMAPVTCSRSTFTGSGRRVLNRICCSCPNASLHSRAMAASMALLPLAASLNRWVMALCSNSKSSTPNGAPFPHGGVGPGMKVGLQPFNPAQVPDDV